MSALKRIPISGDQKDLLQKLTGLTIQLRNTSPHNQKEITELLEQGKQNAFIYLQRNRLGQKLSIFEENNLFTALVDLQQQLNLQKVPRRIECYDISHLSGKFVYGSMVTFFDGKPAKKLYKLFKTKEQNNDFENHREVLARRFQRALEEEISERDTHPTSQNLKPWGLPDLIIVDGGKGQLSADQSVLNEFQEKFTTSHLPFDVEICALAKREEEIFIPDQPNPIFVSGSTKFLVQRIRDEAHRFAITNNRKARLKTARKSQLDDIPGIGPITKQKLLTTFGSTEGLVDALYKNQELVYELVGKQITIKLKNHFGIAN